MNEEIKDLSLEELADKDWLSVRSVNICQRFGLLTLFPVFDIGTPYLILNKSNS